MFRSFFLKFGLAKGLHFHAGLHIKFTSKFSKNQ